MANYFRVSPKFWHDAQVTGWSDQERLLALYLLTNRHRTLEGLYLLPKAYVAEDLGWSLSAVTRALRRLIDAGFVEYDESAKVVLVVNALAYQAPATEKQIIGAVNALDALPSTPLLARFRAVAEIHCHALADRIRMSFGSHSNKTGEESESGSNTRARAASSSSSPSLAHSPSPSGRARTNDFAEQVRGILQRGIDGLTTDEPCKPPTLTAVSDALTRHPVPNDVALAVAVEVRSIAQSQNRAPNIVALFAQRLAAFVQRQAEAAA